MQEVSDQDVQLSLAPYPHRIPNECLEQLKAIAHAMGFGGKLTANNVQLGRLEKMKDKLAHIKYLMLSACRTGLNAARYAKKLMKHLGSFNMVHSLHAAKTDRDNFPRDARKTKESTFLVVSQSGKMKDAANVVNAAQQNDLTIMSIVNSVGSLIACMTKLGVYCNAGRENAITAVPITSVKA